MPRMVTCVSCGEEKEHEAKEMCRQCYVKNRPTGLCSTCFETKRLIYGSGTTCSMCYQRANPEMGLLRTARHRAKRDGLPFDISVEDIAIPEVCPILGIPLQHGEGQPSDNSPSLDKIVPSLGYVRGNICIMSQRANVIKNSGTAEEHRRIADFIDRHISDFANTPIEEAAE